MANELALYNPSDGSVVVYHSEDGTLQLDVQLSEDTVWLTQQQMAMLFNVKENNITYHIKGVYKQRVKQNVAHGADGDGEHTGLGKSLRGDESVEAQRQLHKNSSQSVNMDIVQSVADGVFTGTEAQQEGLGEE